MNANVTIHSIRSPLWVRRQSARRDLNSGNTHLARSLAHELVGSLRSIGGSKPAEEEEEREDHENDDGNLAQDRSGVAKLGPLAATLSGIVPDLLVAELVVDHATQSDAVAEELETRDLGAPDEHGGGNQHDVLEDSAEGEDKGRGLADL